MHNIKAYRTQEGLADISPLSIKRDWMDETWEGHAYKCFPVSLANGLGWYLSFPEDIVFIWDGISDSMADHVKILKGSKYAYSERGNATISFHTGIMLRSEENVTIFHMPVPNYIRDGVQPFSTLISTSFFNGDIPCAWRITRPNVEITIKAGTPIIALVPINLEDIQGSSIEFEDIKNFDPRGFDSNEYSKALWELNKEGKWSNFYRNAVNHLGKKMGRHQVKAIRLSVKDNLDN